MSSIEAVDADFTRRLPKIEVRRSYLLFPPLPSPSTLHTPPSVPHLPKLTSTQLHAHLSGSISLTTLHNLWLQQKSLSLSFNIPFSLEDPLLALSPEKNSFYDINTFFPLFSKYIYHLIPTISALKIATHSILSDFEKVGVIYVELRTTPRVLPGDCNGQDGVGKNGYVQTILESLDERNRKGDLKATLILSIDRSNSFEEAMEVVDLAIKYKSKGIVGIDLCGNPRTKPNGELLIFTPAFQKAKESGLKVTVHFGEIKENAVDEEMNTILEWVPDRLGHICHTTSTAKEEVLKRKLGLEICLSCNVLAKLTMGGFEGHHFREWNGKGCAIALCVSIFYNYFFRRVEWDRWKDVANRIYRLMMWGFLEVRLIMSTYLLLDISV